TRDRESGNGAEVVPWPLSSPPRGAYAPRTGREAGNQGLSSAASLHGRHHVALCQWRDRLCQALALLRQGRGVIMRRLLAIPLVVVALMFPTVAIAQTEITWQAQFRESFGRGSAPSGVGRVMGFGDVTETFESTGSTP